MAEKKKIILEDFEHPQIIFISVRVVDVQDTQKTTRPILNTRKPTYFRWILFLTLGISAIPLIFFPLMVSKHFQNRMEQIWKNDLKHTKIITEFVRQHLRRAGHVLLSVTLLRILSNSTKVKELCSTGEKRIYLNTKMWNNTKWNTQTSQS